MADVYDHSAHSKMAGSKKQSLIVCGIIFASEKEIFITKIGNLVDEFLKQNTTISVSKDAMQKEINMIMKQFNASTVKPLTYEYTSMIVFADEQIILDQKIQNIDSLMNTNSEFESMNYFKALQAQFGNARNMSYSNDVIKIDINVSNGNKVSVHAMVAYSPNDFGKSGGQITVPHDNAGDSKSEPIKVSDLNTLLENLSLGADKPISIRNVFELNNYLYPFEVELIRSISQVLYSRNSGSRNILADNILRHINLQDLVSARTSATADEVVRLKIQAQKPVTIIDDSSRSKHEVMDAIVLPMGHGKTFLTTKHPKNLVDVDTFYDNGDSKLVELRKDAMKSGKWNSYNEYFDELLKTHYGMLSSEIKQNKTLLLHSMHMAKVLGVNVLCAIVLNDEKLVIDSIKSRGGSDDDVKMAIRNRNDVLSEMKQDDVHFAASLNEVEKLVLSSTSISKNVARQSVDVKYSKAKTKGKGSKFVMYAADGSPLYHNPGQRDKEDYLDGKK